MRTLAYLGLSGFEDRITFKLSGGEKKLVSLATVLALKGYSPAMAFLRARYCTIFGCWRI